MEIIITNGGNGDSWYRKKVGEKFTVVDCKFGGGDKNGKTYNVFNPDDSPHEQSVVWKKDCELVLPKAPETTEILNEVKADKGILTEEELKERNRLLVLENDELNAEVIKLTKLFNNIIPMINDIRILDMVSPVLLEMFMKRAKENEKK